MERKGWGSFFRALDWSDKRTKQAEVVRLIKLCFDTEPLEVSVDEDTDGTHYYIGDEYCIRQYIDITITKAIGRSLHTKREHFQASVVLGDPYDHEDAADYKDVGAPEFDAVRAAATLLAEIARDNILNRVWAVLEAEEIAERDKQAQEYYAKQTP
jgi:hypothetical protein